MLPLKTPKCSYNHVSISSLHYISIYTYLFQNYTFNMNCTPVIRDLLEQTLEVEEEDYTPILLPRRRYKSNFEFPFYPPTKINEISDKTTHRENSIVPWSDLEHIYHVNSNYIPHNLDPAPIDELLLNIMDNITDKTTIIGTYYDKQDKILLRSNLVDLHIVSQSALTYLQYNIHTLSQEQYFPPIIPSAYNFNLRDIFFNTYTSFQKLNLPLLLDCIFAIMRLSSTDPELSTYTDILADLIRLLNSSIHNSDAFIEEVPIWQQGLSRPDSDNIEVNT